MGFHVFAETPFGGYPERFQTRLLQLRSSRWLGDSAHCILLAMSDYFEHITSRYRLELLPSVPAFFRRARIGKSLAKGQLVYYGPMPVYYGIGEIKQIHGRFVAVDFRGTGTFGVHEDVLEQQYVIPIPSTTLSRL